MDNGFINISNSVYWVCSLQFSDIAQCIGWKARLGVYWGLYVGLSDLGIFQVAETASSDLIVLPSSSARTFFFFKKSVPSSVD